ncbi:putative hexose transporter [Scheffersomyces amazonensis]|uniref:putative hexose transporter n=1 Tax=Scheffersomyces amazonensis TaxID=1078765 RepID=UPI00315DA872
MSHSKVEYIRDQTDSVSISDKAQLQQELFNNDDFENYAYLDQPWWKYSHFRWLHFYVFLITLTSTSNGYDGSMLNGFQSLEIWNKHMGNPEGSVLGALSNGTTFGSIISFAVASYLSDKFGRKACIIGGLIVTIIGAILQGASYNYAFFLISRIIIGIGFSVAMCSSPSLIAELSYPSYRATCTACYNTLWYFGAIIAAWVTYGTRNINGANAWRVPSYLQGFLPLVQLSMVWMVPESPRFLISKGKSEQARRILHKYHTGSSEDERAHRLVEFEMREIEAALELEKVYSTTRFIDFVRIPTFRKRLFLIVFTAWIMQLSGNGLVSYYLNKVLDSIGITSATKQLQINGCLMIYNFFISVFAACIVYQFRRRTVFLSCISGMLVTYIIWTALSAINQKRNFEQKSLANGVLAMIFLYYLAYNFGANGLPYLYITEILPYSHRAKGINIFSVCQNIILVYNGFVNAIAMEAIEWKYYIVYCCIIAVELVVVYLFYVETYGYTLEEVAKVFGDDATTTLQVVSSPVDKLAVEHAENAENTSSASSKQVLQV